MVLGARAKFKDTGTINDEGEYGVVLTAVDRGMNGGGVDRFHIKIWDLVIYDNQMGGDPDADATTELGGGSILIHQK